MCVIGLAVAKYFTNFNEYGLIQFIITSKKLQFITSGLLSGSIAFTKLFVCATLREDVSAPDYQPSPFSCSRFAPGSHTTFPFEMFLFVVRSILTWVAFSMLWNFDETVKMQRRTMHAIEAQQRLRNNERRGLLGRWNTALLGALSWLLALSAVLAVVRAIWVTTSAAFERPPELTAVLSAGSTSAEQHMAAVAAAAAQTPTFGAVFGLLNEALLSWLDVVLLVLTLQLTLHRLLNTPTVTARPAKAGTTLAVVATLYMMLRLDVPWLFGLGSASDPAAGAWLQVALDDPQRAPRALALIFAAFAACISLALVCKQNEAQRKDEAAVEKLKALMEALDTDHNGSISKSELRSKYQMFFVDERAAADVLYEQPAPGGGAGNPAPRRRGTVAPPNFEAFWAKVRREPPDWRLELVSLARDRLAFPPCLPTLPF